MFLSTIIRSIRSRLATKLILVVVILLSAVSILLTSFFIIRQRRLLTGELSTRTYSLAQNLAYNSRHYLLLPDTTMIQSFVWGVKEEPDIANVYLTDLEGAILATTDISQTRKILTIPVVSDSMPEKAWFSGETETTKRIIVPVEVDIPFIDTDTMLVPPLNDTITLKYGDLRQILFLHPGFNCNSDDIVFTSASVAGDFSMTSIMSVKLSDCHLRLLIDSAANPCWSHNGQYLAFNKSIKPKISELTVFDKGTGTTKSIKSGESGVYGLPCFTPDDQYIINTLQNRYGQDCLFKIPRDGGSPEQLTFHDGYHWLPDCSPDGKWILYSDSQIKVIYFYNTETKESSRIFPNMEELHWCASFSPDGKQFCYIRCTDISSDSWEIFIADFPADGKPLTDSAGYGIQLTTSRTNKWYTDWSPDGKWITYAQRDQAYRLRNDIWIVPSRGGDPQNLTGSAQSYKNKVGYAVLDVSMENLNRAITEGSRIALILSLLFTVIGILSTFLLKLLKEKDIRNRELEGAYQELQKLDKAKDDFLSLVSHEFRTPLSTIILYTQMLFDEQVDSKENRERYLTTIINNSKRLARLVNDVLDLSKIETGMMSFAKETLPAKDLVEEAIKNFSPIVTEHKIRLIYEDIPENILLLGDRDKTIQVLTNIISNAIKYTPSKGTIRVSVCNDEKMATIAVKDTGKGIPKEDIPKIFDRFVQLENIEHHTDGSGLGLTISKTIIEHQGGKIWVESEQGKGTTVFLTIPLSKEQSGHKYAHFKKTKDSSKISNNSVINSKLRKILIVDDEEAIRIALKDCIKNSGFDSIEAKNGDEALQLVKEYHPSVIILDVMLPDISGLEVCRKLKDDPKTKKIKIIILSARGQEKEKEEGLKAGADRYVTKPFDYVELMRIVEELLEK